MLLIIFSILLLILAVNASQCNVNSSMEEDFIEKYDPNIGTFLTPWTQSCPESTNRKTIKKIYNKDYWFCKPYNQLRSPHKFQDWGKMLNESTGLYFQEEMKGNSKLNLLTPYIIDPKTDCPIGTIKNSIEVIEYIRYKLCFPFPEESDQFVNWNKLLFDKKGLYIQ